MAFTVDSIEGRTLLALRAGAMTTGELNERFDGRHAANGLERRGLVRFDGEFFRLTEAGHAACPFRNPLAAGAVQPVVAKLPTEEIMVTRSEVLQHIKSCGAAGVTRKNLVASISAPENVVDQHIGALSKAGAIVKPTRGLLVAVDHALNPPTGAASAPVIPPAAHRGVATHPAGEGAKPPLPAAPTRPGQEDFQFCLWDDGQLDIAIGREIIEIPPQAALRLCKFLGNAEAA